MAVLNQPFTLDDVIERYLKTMYDFSPSAAAGLGLHEYDAQIPDLAIPAVDAHIVALNAILQQVQTLEIEPNDKEATFNRDLLVRTIKYDLFQIRDLEPHTTSPMFYAYQLDISQYIKRNYANIETRLTQLTRHLALLPQIVHYAKENLKTSLPLVNLRTSLGICEGSITYFENEVSQEFEHNANPALQAEFAATKAQAIAAIQDYVAFLKEREAQAHTKYAIGADNFSAMLKFGEMVDMPLERVLQVGLDDLANNQQSLREACEAFRPGKSLAEIMGEIIKDHPTAENLVPHTVANLEEVRQFLLDHEIVSVPSEVRCLVRETPSFMRFAFAFMDPAGAFETVATESYYYLTPPETNWTEQQKEEWLTKFDYYTLQDVSIHEAYPGHYVQLLHQNLNEQKLRKVVWNYSFGEGWAHYTEQMMLEEGYRSDDPRYRIAQLAEALLRNARYIVAIKIHTEDMSVEEATRFLMENAYMEEMPARSEAERGTYDPGFLNYTLGKLLILKLREDYRAQQGAAYSLKDFHDKLLSYGAPPVPLIRTMMLTHNNGELL